MSDIKESDLEDKTLMCKDCGKKFIFTAGEQKFFIDKGLQNIPKRCKPCAAIYKAKLNEKQPRTWIQCVSCGRKAEVTFKPKTDEILCEECFKKAIERRDEKIKAMGESLPS